MPRKKSPRLRGAVVPELGHLHGRRARSLAMAPAQGRCILDNPIRVNEVGERDLLFFLRGPNWRSRRCSCMLNPLNKNSEQLFQSVMSEGILIIRPSFFQISCAAPMVIHWSVRTLLVCAL